MRVVVIPLEAGWAPAFPKRKSLGRKLLVLGEVGASATAAISLLGEASVHPIRQVSGTSIDVREAVFGLVQHHGITDVVVDWPRNVSQALHNEICDCLLTLKRDGIRVHELSRFFERVLGRLVVHEQAVKDLISGSHYHFDRRWQATKRALDITLAAGMLTLTAPLLAIVAAAIRATSTGPILYRQERVGHRGRVFRIIKFRSMRVDAEQDGNAQFAARRDERVTPIGRLLRMTRIDELPQLFNVLVGDMSIVGPRPERPVFVERFKQSLALYDMRHHAKPGITGWAQVKDAYAASEAETHRKLSCDLYYIKRGSLLMDLEIMARTIFVIILCRGSR